MMFDNMTDAYLYTKYILYEKGSEPHIRIKSYENLPVRRFEKGCIESLGIGWGIAHAGTLKIGNAAQKSKSYAGFTLA